jgi:hypothetical protein
VKRRPASSSTRPPEAPRTPVQENSDDLARWQDALAADVAAITKLARQHGWVYAPMLKLELGLDRGRITIPVRDAERRLIGLLRYQPAPRCGKPNMPAAGGSRRALLPHLDRLPDGQRLEPGWAMRQGPATTGISRYGCR